MATTTIDTRRNPVIRVKDLTTSPEFIELRNKTLALSGGVVPITPTTDLTARIEDGNFTAKPTIADTYPNAGNLSVTQEELNENDVTFLYVDSTWHKVVTQRLTDQSFNTYKILSQNSLTDKFAELVNNIYIIGYELQPGQKFDITYFGLNSSVGFNGSRFGIQIGIRQGGDIIYPTNYMLLTNEDVAGKTLQLYGNGAELDVAGAKVYIEFKSDAVIGSEVIFDQVTGYFDLPYISHQTTQKEIKIAQLTLEEAVVKTYKILGPTTALNLFSKVVENIYITGAPVLAANERFSLAYVGFNTTQAQGLGAFMVQLCVVNTTDNSFSKNSNYSLFQTPTPKQFVELINKDGELGAEGVRMFVKFKDFGTYPSQSILEGGQSQSILLLPEFSSNDNALLIDNRRTYTIKEKTAGSDFFNTYVEEIYINSSEQLPFGSGYTLIYTAANYSGLGKFMIQLAVLDQANNATKPSNYYLDVEPKNGEILRLIPRDGDLMTTTDVFIKFKNFGFYPTEVLGLYYISGNIAINPYSYTSETSAVLKNVESVRPKPDEDIYSVTVNPTSANAIQDAISLSPGGFYPGEAPRNSVININPGLYKITNSSQFLANPDYPAMIMPKDNMHLLGTNSDDCIIDAGLPYNDGDIDTAKPRNNHQTLWNWAHNVIVENLTFIARNMRYTVHQDNPNESNGERWYKNCVFHFIGDKASLRAMGVGTWSGSITNVWGGKSICDVAAPVAIHNNVAFTKKSKWSFFDHEFINNSGTDFIVLQNSGSLIQDILELKDCSFGASHKFVFYDWWIYVPGANSHFNHADWKVVGKGNAPILFENTVNCKSLAVRSATTGNNSTVRFDVSSSAYATLIGNPRNIYGSIGSPERKIQDKYIIQDGSPGLAGLSIGCVSIREDDYLFGTTASQDKMGLRLGNCSTTNKVLRIIVDGTTYTVTFNKNYTSFTNAQVIAEINAVLGPAGTAYEHNVGREYYCEFTDCMAMATNYSTTDPILKGAIVTKVDGRILPANTGDPIYGVALDDIPAFSAVQGVVRGKGRIMTRNYISVLNTESHFVLADSDCTIGEKYIVQTGQLVKDNANGNIRCLANSTVAINC